MPPTRGPAVTRRSPVRGPILRERASRFLSRGLERAPGRVRRWIAIALAVAVAVAAAFLAMRPAIERAARSRIEREAARRGLSAQIGSVDLRPWLCLVVRDLTLERPGGFRATVSEAVFGPHLSPRGLLGRATNLSLAGLVADLPAGLRIEVGPSRWAIDLPSSGLAVERLKRRERLRLELGARRGRPLLFEAKNARLSELVRVLHRGCTLAELGTVNGRVQVDEVPGGAMTALAQLRTAGLRVGSPAAIDGPPCAGTGLGAPTDAELEADASVVPASGELRVTRFRVRAGGIDASGRATVDHAPADPRLDLDFKVARLDLARVLETAGLEIQTQDLGAAVFGARVRGRVLVPASLEVSQHLDFTPPARPLPAIARLNAPFVQRAFTRDGQAVQILVSPESPDFIPIADVPPLLLRALLLAEDSNFYGHRGIDLSELPSAMATNWARGGFARGASTITQQLAKNLFLSTEKTVRRKVQEFCLALLIEAAVGKTRILEIYLNIIEWGPGIYGLRPAARHYFGKEPAALTTKEIAFLIALIPGPIKYQRSIAGAVPSSSFEALMAGLLAKLRSVEAIDEPEYQAALAEPLALRIGTALADPQAVDPQGAEAPEGDLAPQGDPPSSPPDALPL
jgi:hypothetical protein